MLRHYKDTSNKWQLPWTRNLSHKLRIASHKSSIICHQSPITSHQSFFTTKRNFRRPPLHRGAAPLAGRWAHVARSGTHRPRTGSAVGSDKQCSFFATRGASASPRGERDPHRWIANDGSGTGNYHRRSMVQASGRNAKTFSRSSGIAASNGGNRRALQLATRTGQADLSGVYRSGRRDAGFLFAKIEPRWRAETLSLINTRSAFAADA